VAFKKGESGNPNGRPPGVPNRITSSVKAAILEALNADEGATEFFRALKNGSKEDKRTFAHICARLLPTEITGPDGSPLLETDSPDLLEVARSISFVLTRTETKMDDSEKLPDAKENSTALSLLDPSEQFNPVNLDVLRNVNGNALTAQKDGTGAQDV